MKRQRLKVVEYLVLKRNLLRFLKLKKLPIKVLTVRFAGADWFRLEANPQFSIKMPFGQMATFRTLIVPLSVRKKNNSQFFLKP